METNCENSHGSGDIEATNDINKDSMISTSFDQTLDCTNNTNISFSNSNTTTCASESALFFERDSYDSHKYDDNCTNNAIQEENLENNEETVRKETELREELFGGLMHLQKYLGDIESSYERTFHMLHSGEKSIDSGISSDNINIDDNNEKIARQLIDNYIDSKSTAEENNVIICANPEEEEEEEDISYIDNTKKFLREELDIVTESNDCYTNNSEIKSDIDLSKCTNKDVKNILSNINTEEDSTKIVIAEETNQISENILYATNDQQHAEERMLEALSTAEEENNQDGVMSRIIEDYTDVSMIDLGIPNHSVCRKANMALRRSNSECTIEKFQGDKFLPCQDVYETVIAKEDILKTIEEAKKILTDSSYWNTSETNVKQAADVKDNSLEKLSDEVQSDKECETVNETKNNSIEVEDAAIKLPNVKIERVVSKSDVAQSNLQRLAEITCSDRPKSLIEIHETIEKIAEEKRRIEDRKKESLETLSRKFDEIEKLVGDYNDTSSTFDNDPCDVKIPDDVADESDGLDEFQVDPEDLEMPLTKSEITENLKIEELERQLANEIEEHKLLIDEYQKMISTDLVDAQETALESQSTRVCDDEDVNAEIKAESENDEQVVEKSQNETSDPPDDLVSVQVDLESNDSLSDFHEEQERTYIKGKVYDFDEKKHGVR